MPASYSNHNMRDYAPPIMPALHIGHSHLSLPAAAGDVVVGGAASPEPSPTTKGPSSAPQVMEGIAAPQVTKAAQVRRQQ